MPLSAAAGKAIRAKANTRADIRLHDTVF